MRHGKPVLPSTGWIGAAEMGAWIRCYDLSEVAADGLPDASVALAASASCVVASAAPRALTSAHMLGRRPELTDAIYCEAQLPYAGWRFPRLPPALWAGFFRLLWFCGYARQAESIRATRTRAKEAADRLVSMAADGPVLLVGHGIMNRLIAGELVGRGWSALGKHNSGHWGASEYVLNAAACRLRRETNG